MNYKNLFKFKSTLTIVLIILSLNLSLNSSFADNEKRDIEALVRSILNNLKSNIASQRLTEYQPQSLIPSLLILNAYSSQMASGDTPNSEQLERVENVVGNIATLYFTEAQWRRLTTDNDMARRNLLHLANLQALLLRTLEILGVERPGAFFLDDFVSSLKAAIIPITTGYQRIATERLVADWEILLSITRFRDLYPRESTRAFNAMGEILAELEKYTALSDTKTAFEAQYTRSQNAGRFSAIKNLVAEAKEQLTNSNPSSKATYIPLAPIEVLISIATVKTKGTWPEASLIISAREGVIDLLSFIDNLPANGNTQAAANEIRKALEGAPVLYDPSLSLDSVENRSGRQEIISVIQSELRGPPQEHRIVLVKILGIIPATSELSERQIHGILTQLLFSSEASRDPALALHILDTAEKRGDPLGLKVLQSAVELFFLADQLRIEALKKLIRSEQKTPAEFVATKETMERVVAFAEQSPTTFRFAINAAHTLQQSSNELASPKLDQIALATMTRLTNQSKKNPEKQKLINDLTDAYLARIRADKPSVGSIPTPTIPTISRAPKTTWLSRLSPRDRSREPRR